jgi:predicted DNA-binding protein (MmcQ/YjbR family)
MSPTPRRAEVGTPPLSNENKTAALVRAARQFPGAWEDVPWGERVAKVGKKVFAFLGRDGDDEPHVSVKLPESCHQALTLTCCEPTGYGMGRAGWVTIRLHDPDCPSLGVLLDWLDESYRAIAPHKLIDQLDADG